MMSEAWSGESMLLATFAIAPIAPPCNFLPLALFHLFPLLLFHSFMFMVPDPFLADRAIPSQISTVAAEIN